MCRQGWSSTLQGAEYGHGGSEAPGYARRIRADSTDGGRQASTSTFRRTAETLNEVQSRAVTGAYQKGVADEVDEAIAMVRDVIVHRHYLDLDLSVCAYIIDRLPNGGVVASKDVNRWAGSTS